MEIIENNNADIKVCPHCNTMLRYNIDDILSWDKDYEYIICPYCHNDIILENETPTCETIKYPIHFHSLANAVEIKNDQIQKWVTECVNHLDKDNNYYMISSGDTIVFAYKCDEDFHLANVVVAKKYQETDVEIPIGKF